MKNCLFFLFTYALMSVVYKHKQFIPSDANYRSYRSLCQSKPTHTHAATMLIQQASACVCYLYLNVQSVCLTLALYFSEGYSEVRYYSLSLSW